jgi:hypothetical protein
MPVATTDTRIWPSIAGSSVEPTMMLASGSTSSRIRFAASSSSNSVRSYAAGDVDQHAARALQADLVQKRVGDGLFGGLHGALFALGLAGAHHRLAHLVHHRAHIGEVEIDQARTHHQVGHPLDALIEHIIGQREGLGEGGLSLASRNRFWLGMMISVSTTFAAPRRLLGLAHPLRALELERFGDDPDRQHAKLARGLGDDRRRAGAGAAAHPGGDEAHMRAGEQIDDLLDRLFGGGRTDRGQGTRAQPFGHFQRPSGSWPRPGTAPAPAHRCWRRRNRRLRVALAIMLLTALPPAPPTPKTVICGLRSRCSGIRRFSVIVAVRLFCLLPGFFRLCRPG